ncbi:MAG: prepilin-type N-terminal cleavage/methylation domain-containing protein [Candidatus Falkowbacteria bacterium]|nr:prepilin-type N-terminal cleavage/methylation domain-containing protein [Candidatus Parcubacteria bacterium]
MLNKIIKNNAGVTLLELTVAVAIFSFAVLSATQIFKMVLEGQRSAIAAQSTQESMRYALEVMSKEIRMAQKTRTGSGPPECGIPKGTVYLTIAGNNLIFKNIHDQCVEYSLENDTNGIPRLKIKRDSDFAYITPDEIEVSDLEFIVVDDKVVSDQSSVVMKMIVQAVGQESHKSEMKIQTAISSRYYE